MKLLCLKSGTVFRFFKYFSVGLLVGIAATTAGQESIRPSFPTVRLLSKARGEGAIQSLGTQLTNIAAFYHRTPDELRGLFRRDKSLWADRNGRLFYVCNWAMPANAASSETNMTSASEAIAPPDQTFSLHSRPGSKRIIYLDFDGYTISGTAWNVQNNNGADIVAPPWDTDGNPSSFSASERTAIQQIWLRVSEDYSPYDVDVTTEYPGEAALTRSNGGDQAYGVRALISPIGDYFGNPGGIAYVGVFNETGDDYKPALIFPENLANNEKYIAEAISHEVGHTLGLNHDGTSTSDYYEGQGNWAPIMGVGYYEPITQWSKGEYASANNQQDDLTVISQHGISFRADDFGNSIATASALSGTNISVDGLIGRTADVDFFSFQTSAGAVQINVMPWQRGANLHFIVSIYDSNGVLVTNREGSDSSSGVQPVSIRQTVNSGTYYVSVQGKGSGNPLTDGYSDYASLGHYTVAVTLPAVPQMSPQLASSLISGPRLLMQFSTEPGINYVLQSTTNLVPPIVWTTEETTQGNGSAMSFQAPVGTDEPQKFFRVRVQ
jgi:hypothetical protein